MIRTSAGDAPSDIRLGPPLLPFVDRLPVPRRLVAAENEGRLVVRMRAAQHRFHRDTHESTIWGYDGPVPGPTIEAERGHPVTVEWQNELIGPLPVVVTTAPGHAHANGVPVQCVPGLSGGAPDLNAAALSGHAVVHLHGGLTPAVYGGRAGNLLAPGQSAGFHRPPDQPGGPRWHPRPLMGGARLDVPARPGVMEAFPPFTVVNGKVWPVLEVHPALYRLRMLNGSNARTYRLVLFKDGEPELDRITQIGTDHGLLRGPVHVPSDGLVLASAERADVLVDFSDLEPGSELTLLNTAKAPFDGSPFPAANAETATDLDGLLVYPYVMRFRVVPGQATRRTIPQVLATDYGVHSSQDLGGAPHRAIALVERELVDGPNMLTMRELALVAQDVHGPVVTVTDNGRAERYRVVAAHFEDATTFFPMLGQDEISQLINLTRATHPIHLHLDPFQILSRRPIRYEIAEGGIQDFALTAAVVVERDPDDTLDHTIDDNERGLKDTIRVNPHEIVELAVRFRNHSGRYMYHCHILEHEDRDMMRPFVTMPMELMPFMVTS